MYKDLYGKPFPRDWVARVVFPIQILIFGSHWDRSLLLIYTAENLQLPNFNVVPRKT